MSVRPWMKHGLLVGVGLVIAAWAFFLLHEAEHRGFTYSGLLQIEAAEAAAHAEGDEPAFAMYPLRGPLNGLLPHSLEPLLAGDATPLRSTRLGNALCIALTVFAVFFFTLRSGGALAAVTAAITLVAIPRVWAAGITPGLTAPALCLMTWTAFVIERARDRWFLFLPAVVLLVSSILTTQLAFLLVIPWVYLTFFDSSRETPRALLVPRHLSAWAPFVFPVALIAVVMLLPGFFGEELGKPLTYLRSFMEQPRQGTLYYGILYDNERLPWHAAWVLIGVTTPPTLLFLGIIGLFVASPFKRFLRGTSQIRPDQRDDVEAGRLAWSMLLLTGFLPFALGTITSHGVDLLALTAPWVAYFAGVGIRRVVRTIAVPLRETLERLAWAKVGTRVTLTMLVWSIFAFAFHDTTRAYPDIEAYYNWLIDGTDGAAEVGMARNPGAPIPPRLLSQLVANPEDTGMRIYPEDHTLWAVLDKYRDLGLMPHPIHWAEIDAAQVVLMRYDETQRSYYDRLPEVLDTVAATPADQVIWIEREGIPLFGAVILNR